MNRRQHLQKMGLGLAGSLLATNSFSIAKNENEKSPIPALGEIWQESKAQLDPVTGRTLLQITSKRDFNQKPTYHIGSGFSSDGQKLPIVSWNEDGASCLMLADLRAGNLKVIDVPEPGSSFSYVKAGNDLSMIPSTGKLVAGLSARMLKIFDIQTGKGEILLPDVGPDFTLGHPIGSIDGKKVFVPKMKIIPPGTQDFKPYCLVDYLEIDLNSKANRSVFVDEGHRNNHLIPNPVNPDLWLIDRDLPPGFARGGDGGKTTRCWILNIRTGQLTEVRPKAENRFQVHGNWNFEGTHVYYHGLAMPPEKRENPKSFNGNSHYIGVSDLAGKVVWEKSFPKSWYGHVSSHPKEYMVVLDGLITESHITGVRWDKRDATGEPEIVLFGNHGSDWGNIGQHAHPHCQLSPDGKWLSYNRSYAGRSDVFVLKVG